MLIEALKKVDKRRRYLVQAVLACGFVMLEGLGTRHLSGTALLVVTGLFIVIGTFILHYPNVQFSNLLPTIILPSGIVAAGMFSLRTYPEFGLPLKVMVVAYVGVMYYLASLMDNIFLVVYEREESIPLYRVATSWSQIFQILVAIPLFSCIFKLDSVGSTQGIITALLAVVFLLHQIWIQSFDSDTKRVGVWEMIFLSLFGGFVVLAGTLAVSFFPAEGFLRALFSAAILLFVLNYVIGYLKNEITKKLVIQYLSIVAIFFGLLVFFTT